MVTSTSPHSGIGHEFGKSLALVLEVSYAKSTPSGDVRAVRARLKVSTLRTEGLIDTQSREPVTWRPRMAQDFSLLRATRWEGAVAPAAIAVVMCVPAIPDSGSARCSSARWSASAWS